VSVVGGVPDFWKLIADEQQIYDLNYLDDQLVLESKGHSALSN